MKPIGAGRIGGLVVRERGLVRIKPLANKCACSQEEDHSGVEVETGILKVFSSLNIFSAL